MSAASRARRRVLTRGVALGASALAGPWLAGCDVPPRATPGAAPAPPTAWVGASVARGHRLRRGEALPTPAVQRRRAVLVVGGGVAGLAAARCFLQQGVDDLALLELEDRAGGNARGHVLQGLACPLGAHYLPVPTPGAPETRELQQWLHEIGLFTRDAAGRTVAEERHLCHSPQERLFVDGAWREGLLPPADPGSATAAAYRRFAAAVRRAMALAPPGGPRAFAQPAHRGAWNGALAALDTETFAQWLDREGLTDERLRWYLDYTCRDDFGAPAAVVSAWAGLHYFASRHGFQAPGEDGGEPDPVFTWPEGNAWLTERLAAPLGERLHTGRTVLRVQPQRHGVRVWAWDEAAHQLEAWDAGTVVMAVPLFVAARLLEAPAEPWADALRRAAASVVQAPWLVANLHLDGPLLDRPGAAPAWDNVVYGSRALGYVDALHQSLRPHPHAPTVLTSYHPLPVAERAALLADDPAPWRERVLASLRPVHPDIDQRLGAVHLARWGHAMAVPVPGTQRHPALQALRAPAVQRARLRFAHADLAGVSVFEEAFTAGCEAAAAPPRRPGPAGALA